MSLSGVSEVHEFPCGHYYTPESGFVHYYHLPPAKDYHLSDVDHAARLIRSTLSQAIKKRLLADKQIHVGAFCSGGLDSSLIAAIAARDITNLYTFAVGMRDGSGKESDDLVAARVAADHIGSNHHEYLITEEDYYEALPRVIEKLETYDPSLVRCAVPCYFTCKLAAENVTVVLTGGGADEIFAGYHYMKRFAWDQINAEARRLIAGVHNINLQRADRMGMLFSLELRVPFFDTDMIDLGMKLSPTPMPQLLKRPAAVWAASWLPNPPVRQASALPRRSPIPSIPMERSNSSIPTKRAKFYRMDRFSWPPIPIQAMILKPSWWVCPWILLAAARSSMGICPVNTSQTSSLYDGGHQTANLTMG
jgi:asparagine synthetase B (glutamine-hydrolysing)